MRFFYYFGGVVCMFLLAFANATKVVKETIDSKKWNEQLEDFGTLAWQLPDISSPQSYELWLYTNFPKNLDSYSGKNVIQTTFNQDSDELWLHAKDLEIQNVAIKDVENKMQDISEIHYDQKEDVLIIKALKKDFKYLTFEQGQLYIVEIEFLGKIRKDGFGFFRVSHIKNDIEIVTGAVTYVSPNGARWAFPCYDEPRFRTDFKLYVSHTANYTAFSNMPVQKNTLSSDTESSLTEFETAKQIKTYSIGIAILADFTEISYPDFKVNKMPQSAFVPSSLNDYDKVNVSMSNYFEGGQMLKEYLNVSCRTPKVDHIFIADHAPTSIENLGLIIKELGPTKSPFEMGEIVLYSSVYQYLGNFLGPKYWNETWLANSISIFLALKFSDMLHPGSHMSDSFNLIQCKSPYLQEYNLSIAQDLTTANDFLKIYNPHVISLGTCFMEMTEAFLGNDVVQQGLQIYAKKENAQGMDEDILFESLQDAYEKKNSAKKGNVDLKEVLKSWTKLRQFPTINITVNYETETIYIEQLEYYSLAPEKACWVPLRFATSEEVMEEIFFMPPVEKFSLKFSSLKMNLLPDYCLYVATNDRAMYPVLYDQENLKCLALALRKKHKAFSSYERAALVRNIFDDMTQNGEKFGVHLDLLKYLKDEQDVYVWTAFGFGFYHTDLLKSFRGSKAYQPLKEYLADLYSNIVTKIPDVDLEIEEDGFQKYHLGFLISIGYTLEIPSVVQKVKNKTMDALRNAKNSAYFNLMLRNCVAFQTLTDSEFYEVIELVKKNYDDVIKNLNQLLRCTINKEHQKELEDIFSKHNKTIEFIGEISCDDGVYCYKKTSPYYDAIYDWFLKNTESQIDAKHAKD